jgi:polysaccharide biosynthesis/export protein
VRVRRALAVALAAAVIGGATAPATAQPASPPAPDRPRPEANLLPSPPAASPTPSPEYRLGPGDVLEIEVFDNPELSRNAVVQTDGTVALPLLGEVPLAGLTIAEAKDRLIERLGRDYLVNPQVDVRVKEYQSQFVTVTGEIASPGRKPLRGARTRLIDVLVEAGGLTPRASGEIVVTRSDGTFDNGTRSVRVQLGGASLSPELELPLQAVLRSGDIITVSPKYYVTVEGEVARPGRYVLDVALTVSGAVSSAGGLTRFGRQRVQVRRIEAATGRVRVFDVDLKAVRKGDAEDPPLQPNDTISVSRRLF